MVNAINGTYGSPKGYRAVHAKGFCGAGTLTAGPEAAEYTKSALFDGHAVPTMFRFSLAPGVPRFLGHGAGPQVARRTAMEDADGTTMDLIMINVPFVFVKDPADFAPFFRAIAPDPATGKADPAKVKAHFDKHPEAARFVEFLERVAHSRQLCDREPFYDGPHLLLHQRPGRAAAGALDRRARGGPGRG